MRIIPVIDLKDGQVVHARQGLRDMYQPINTPLCASSDIFQVLGAFLGLYPFDCVYIADLNALQGKGNHNGLISEALQTYPEIDFWIDKGHVSVAEVQPQPANYWPVLGSESLRMETIGELSGFCARYILSLDFFGDAARGPQVLFDDPEYWPKRIILMTLGRVGARQGPDFKLLATYRRNHPHRKFVAAGGVRDNADIMRLKALGIDQVLIASALHDGRLGAADIRKIHAA